MQKIIFLAISFHLSYSFSIPGESEKRFHQNEPVEIEVNELDSLQTLFPVAYYKLGFCQPEKIHEKEENLGNKLLGEQTSNSPYEVQPQLQISMNLNETSKFLCNKTLSYNQIEKFEWFIDHEYKISYVIDNLPSINQYLNKTQVGIPIGFKKVSSQFQSQYYYIYNHLVFKIYIHKREAQFRVVRFEITPDIRSNSKLQYQKDDKVIEFTYDVQFIPSNRTQGSRWDVYEKLGNEEIHWFSILNSLFVVILLSFTILYILRSTLNKDILRYRGQNDFNNIEAQVLQEPEDNGWKQLSRDVFVAPSQPLLLSVLFGTGIHLFAIITTFQFLISFGIHDITERGQFLTLGLLSYSVFGAFSGYSAARQSNYPRFYKMLQGYYTFRLLIITAIFYPTITMGLYLYVNIFLEMEDSANAIDMQAFFQLLALFLFIHLPLVLFGGIVGHRSEALRNPVKPNLMPKKVPKQPFYNNWLFCCAIGGILPFGAVMLELSFVMSSLWKHSFYYLFLFFAISIFILQITCAQISIVLTYMQLVQGNHRWWWKAFLCPAFTSVFVFFYSIIYFFKYLNITRFSSIVMYFCYMFIISFNFFIICGVCGLIASYFFVRQIYSMIKID